jgi:hypothetical protein
MGKELDELSKALASGVSRRAAVRRFVFGSLGAVAASLLPGRTSFAQNQTGIADCVQRCTHCGSGEEFRICVAICEAETHFNLTQFNATQFNTTHFNLTRFNVCLPLA